MFEMVHTLWNKIKANAFSVYSHHGGGTHGHIGLVLTAAQYADISNSVFTCPAHPGPLAIPPAATAVQRSTIQDSHIKDLQVFREVMGVEQVLFQKIVATIDATYLEDVRDRTTNSINISMSALLLHLQYTYVTLMPHELQGKEYKAKKNINPGDPIASVFWVVDDLVKLAALAATTISIMKQVNIGYVILRKTGKFSQPIVEWNRKRFVDKTWDNFKTHFCTAHKELHATTNLMAQDAGIHHANMVRDVVAALRETLSTPAEPEVVPTEENRAPSLPLNFNNQMANAMATSDANQQQMFQQMKTMIETMQSMNINNGGGYFNKGRNNQQQGLGWNQKSNNNNNGNHGYQGNTNRNQNYGNNNGNNNNGNSNINSNGNKNKKTIRQCTAGRMDFVLTWE